MFDLEEFIADCRATAAGDRSQRHVRDVVARAVSRPDEILKDVPMDGSTYIVILTHDPKFDDPTITAALRGRPRYIGAIGSRKTHRDRVTRLTAAGVSPTEIEEVAYAITLVRDAVALGVEDATLG